MLVVHACAMWCVIILQATHNLKNLLHEFERI